MDRLTSQIELDLNSDFLLVIYVTLGRVLNISEFHVETPVK